MLKKTRILIIDDNENMLETISDILQAKGYDTETARTGKEALEKAKRKVFNVALIDIQLPDTTGIKILQTFRRRYPTRKNIIITGNATLQNTIEALNQGANAYVVKPIDHEQLDRSLKQCIEEQDNVEKAVAEIRREISERKLITRVYEPF